MTFRVVHRTEYRYDRDVFSTYGEARLHPREAPGQQCYSTTLSVDPFPEEYRVRRDFFGNRVAHYSVLEPHTVLVVTASSVVDVGGRQTVLPLVGDRAWDEVRDTVRLGADPEVLDARQYLLPSPAAPVSNGAEDYVATSFAPGRGLLDVLGELATRIHDDFDYLPGSTDVNTTVDELLQRRTGVCQDYAHLAIVGLRAHGLPARYVSGYLETAPPAGMERRQGADVSHAWLSVYVPSVGWVDLDPTNDQFVDDRYVTVAWGRDYSDVPPLKGVIFTESEHHELDVTVDVIELPPGDPALGVA
jgi:transglutaminase-like putative cysteine protease